MTRKIALILNIIFGSITFSCTKKIPNFELSKNSIDAITILEPKLLKKVNPKNFAKENTVCEILNYVIFIDSSNAISNSQYSEDIKLLLFTDIQSHFAKSKSYEDHNCYDDLNKILKQKKIYLSHKITNDEKIVFHLKNRNWPYLWKKLTEPENSRWALLIGLCLTVLTFILIYRWKKK